MNQSGKPVSQVAKEMDPTESTLRKWVKQAQVEQNLKLEVSESVDRGQLYVTPRPT